MTEQASHKSGVVLALDVGDRRIGVARANLEVRFASPLTTLESPQTFVEDIVSLCQSEEAVYLVIGLPRGLSGQETAQTVKVREFGADLADQLTIPVYWIDEALTSEKAEQELQSRKKRSGYQAMGEVDALAATYILEDFLRENTDG